MATSFSTFSGLRCVSFQVKSTRTAPQLCVSRGKAKFNMAAATLPVLNFEGEKTGEAQLDLKTARPETAKAVVHRAVITQLQNRRRGTASTLTRAEVRGGGRKPYKQKGSGNARMGSKRTPLRPGGGVVFGPKPKDWTIKINKKENQLAISTAIQSAAPDTVVVEDFGDKIAQLPKTREMVGALSRWGVDSEKDYALIFTAEVDQAVDLAARNLKKLKVINPRTLTIYDILRADKLILTQSGLDYLNGQYSAQEFDFGGSWEAEFDDEEDGDEEDGEEEGEDVAEVETVAELVEEVQEEDS